MFPHLKDRAMRPTLFVLVFLTPFAFVFGRVAGHWLDDRNSQRELAGLQELQAEQAGELEGFTRQQEKDREKSEKTWNAWRDLGTRLFLKKMQGQALVAEYKAALEACRNDPTDGNVQLLKGAAIAVKSVVNEVSVLRDEFALAQLAVESDLDAMTAKAIDHPGFDLQIESLRAEVKRGRLLMD